MRADGWDVAGAIEHHPEVNKVRDMVKAVRASMPGDQRDFEGLVCKELHNGHAAEIARNPDMVLALVSWAILHLVEEIELKDFLADEERRAAP
jgi:hypothetical protein